MASFGFAVLELWLVFGLLGPATATAQDQDPNPETNSFSAPLVAPPPAQASVVDSNSGERENVLPAQLNPGATASADAQALYAEGVRRELEEGLTAALPIYRQVLDKDPSFVDLAMRIGLTEVQNHQEEEAEALFTRALAANPESGPLYAGMAYAKQSESKLDEAFALAQKAKALAPDNVLAHRVAFESLRDQGKLPDALDLARAVIAAPSPSSSPALTADDWTELAHLYTELVCASGDLPHDQIAALILPLYDKALSFGNPSAELLRHRGDFALFLDRKAEGYNFLKLASESGEPSAAIYLRLANLCESLDKQDEALQDYEKAYALEPDFPQLREVLALQYIRVNQEPKAIALLEETVRESPTRVGLYTSLGDLYMQSGQLEKAEFNYKQAITLGASQAADYLKLGAVYIRENQLDAAAQLLHEAEGRFPDSARVFFFEGIVQRELKKPADALNYFAQAKILATDKSDDFPNGEYYYEVSMAQEQAGQAGPSEDSLKAGLTLEPNNENILNALAYIWADQGRNLKDALDYSLRATETAPDQGEFVDTLGWVYFRLGKYAKAAPLLERAATLTHDDPVVLGHLADTYLKLGRHADAGEALRKLVEKDPDNPDSRKKLENFLSDPAILSTKNASRP